MGGPCTPLQHSKSAGAGATSGQIISGGAATRNRHFLWAMLAAGALINFTVLG